jgi:hypothetical protein
MAPTAAPEHRSLSRNCKEPGALTVIWVRQREGQTDPNQCDEGSETVVLIRMATRAIKPSQPGWPVIARVAIIALVAMIVATRLLSHIS